MTMKRFIIPSLVAAGFGAHDPAQGALTHATSTGTDDPNAGTLFRIFRQDHAVTLAQHRSHSSHSSHRSGGGGHYSHSSHTSHRSSTGGGPDPYYPTPTPAPVYSPPSPPPPASSGRPRATPPPGAPGESVAAPGNALPALPGRGQRFTAIVRRVQIALMAQGFFAGPITGTVGPATRSSIRRFQLDRGLAQTGTITPALLDALMISSE